MVELKCLDYYKFYLVYCKMCDMLICRECLIGFYNGYKYFDMNVVK